jgi:peptide chain release factor 3
VPADVLREAARRRTFAIISHPDAGKTTLTEKFLLYAGAIGQAGAVDSRKSEGRAATSDWIGMEQERGISVASAVMRFQHRGQVFNLLDTPGHRDFSEDTYRVLSGVDAAVMVLDASRGVEPQTLKLFEVCRRRGTPLLTFINKMDRPAPDTLDILDDIEKQIGVVPTPVTWPVREDGRFMGVVDRRDGSFHRYGDTHRGSRKGTETIGTVEEAIEVAPSAEEELALMDELGEEHDQELFLAGETTPVFFGSALQNFGVRLLLDAVSDMAPTPTPRLDVEDEPRPLDSGFSGFVFKIQANMDPRHRDRIAFVRICSGEFERGMQLTCTRTERSLAAKYVHETLGQDRETIDVAYPGDVIGLVNATDLRIGDTLHAGDPVTYPGLPTFTPEHFRVARPADRSRVKQFRRGIEQLDEEGVIQVLRRADLGDQEPILAAVGVLQFEVAEYRMEHEFGSPLRLDGTSRNMARRTDEDSAARLRSMRDVEIYRRSDGTPIALFKDRFQVERIERDNPELTLDVIVNG